MERLPPLEILRSELHTDGLWHVRYASATRTLCSRPVIETVVMGRPADPTCGRCSKVAREWDRVDGSMPAAWRYVA